jgi:hypothetical protein
MNCDTCPFYFYATFGTRARRLQAAGWSSGLVPRAVSGQALELRAIGEAKSCAKKRQASKWLDACLDDSGRILYISIALSIYSYLFFF